MALVDQIHIRAEAGRGGNGVVRWLHEKSKEFGGPSGGDGGKGGDIIFRAVRDINVLGKYRGKNQFKAEAGEHGKSKNMAGKDGADTYLDVPVGSVITRVESGLSFELLKEGDVGVGLHGGRGGLGNSNFKSSTNQNPEQATDGAPGEKDEFVIELKLIADAGFVGLPNAGKSSLLNALTKAHAKVGNYAFTTLEPSLGVFYNYILADIPGLIEGASEGKGLGHSFLRHVSRTRALIHCVAVDSVNPVADYETVRTELTEYNPILSRKPEILFLTKSDTVSNEVLSTVKAKLSEKNANVVTVSIIDDDLMKQAGDTLTKFLSEH
ncbi:GTPase ObgE [Patescibacteria group bacterium]|nr:GTPase ObgE [Patescibacteria group bacterium]